jgi:transposase
MIPVPSGVRVWIAKGHTDMRRGMQGLARQVQESLKRDPFAGDLYIFRGRRGDLAKILWHHGVGLSLYAKRLDRGNSGNRLIMSITARHARRACSASSTKGGPQKAMTASPIYLSITPRRSLIGADIVVR